MYCWNCGNEIGDTVKFCPYCGAPVVKEESLITRAGKGDNAAIKQIMDEYSGMVRYQARMYVKNEDDVNEIEQQVFIKAFNKISELTDEKKLGGWLKTIAINTAKDYVTSAFKKKSVMFTDLDDTNNDIVYDAEDERIDHRPDVQMDETSRREIILKVLDDLPEMQRMVIVMHYYDNLSFKDISEQLNIPMSTVTGRAQQAKNSIKASVTNIQNRDGIRLYNLTPLAFFFWILRLERNAPVAAAPPVVSTTVKVTKPEPARMDNPHYSEQANNFSKPENIVKDTAKTTAKKAAKAGAGKAAGKGFLATTVGKIVIAGTVAAAAVGGGAAGLHYHNVHNPSDNKEAVSENADQKQAGKKDSDNKETILDEKNIVWVRKPGSMDIDDFNDLQSSPRDGTYLGRYSTIEENTGYSPVWISNSQYSDLVRGYSGNGIIVKKDDLLGIDDYAGKVITNPSYAEIEAITALGVYAVSKPGEDIGTPATYYLDSDYNVKNAGDGFGEGDWATYKIFISGSTVYEIDQEGWAGDQMEDAGQYVMNAPTIMPAIDGYQSGDVDLNTPSGFKLLQKGSDPVDLPKDMTPTYYAAALKYGMSDLETLMNSYDYNTCYVNNVIKLQDQNKKIHLWNAKTGKFVTDQSFDDATFYEDGYIGVKKNDKWAFMDSDGNVVTDYLFDKVSGLYKGKAYVKINGKIGILDLYSSLNKNGLSVKQDNDISMLAGKTFSMNADPNLDSYEGGGNSITFTIDDKGNINGTVISSHSPEEAVSGKFTDWKKINDETYQMKLVNLKSDTDIDQCFGLENNATYTVMLPGTKLSDLNSESKKWIQYKSGNPFDALNNNDDYYLNYFILINNNNKMAITED